MHRNAFMLFVLVLSAKVAIAQQVSLPGHLTGSWNGTLTIMGTSLPLVFHFTSSPDGNLSATLDSPMQNAKGIPVQSVKLVHDSVFVEVRAIGGRYAARLAGAEKMDGQWRQGGQSLPLQLRKGLGEEARRPQEPQKPYPYLEREVAVANKAAALQLAGTLTMPLGKGPFPAVLLLTGSGPQDRDETILGHKPFLVLADYLTRQGFAVLRLDDRGVGKSGGEFTSATTADFASDAAAAFNFLKEQPGIRRTKIGLMGHSEGALVAAKVAVKYPKVAFVVLLAGNAVSGKELLMAQNKAIFQQRGLPEHLLQQYLDLRDEQLEVAATEEVMEKAAERILVAERAAKAKLTPQEIQQLGLTPTSEQALAGQLSSPWMRYFLAYDPVPALRRLRMPVLALYGTKDVQVPHQQNLPAMLDALKEGRNKRNSVQALQDLNHLFQTAVTGSPAEYGALDETMAPVVLEAVGTWMREVVK